MAIELACPTCDGDLMLDGDEKKGQEVICPCCGAPSILTQNADAAECNAQEDF